MAFGKSAGKPRRSRRYRSAVALIAICSAFGAHAEAAGTRCTTATGSWVSVTFVDGGWGEELAQAIVTDLDTGLKRRGLSACRAPDVPAHPPLAVISLALVAGESVTVTVDIRDALTNKRVTRSLELAPIPLDGRALAVALAADELTWASWAELALAEQPRQGAAPRPIVLELERRRAPTSARWSRLGVGLGFEHYTGRLTLVGVDVSYEPRLAERVAVELGLGLRQGLETAAPDGSIGAVAIGLDAGFQAILLRSRYLELTLTGGERTSYVRFSARANPTANASSVSGLTVYARAGVRAILLVAEPMWVGLGIGGGVPLRAVEVTDQGQSVVGMSGFEGAGDLRIGASW